MKRILILIYGVIMSSSVCAQLIKDTVRAEIEGVMIKALPLQSSFNYLQNELHVNQNSALLAATFDDPSRVLYRHVGISTSNDEANGIIYRGLPSSSTKWTIYGAEIVNPNHTSNAGTFDDYTSSSAGGVLALPFEVINKFNFFGAPLSSGKVNALSGIMDFEFGAKGRNFYKLGLLGMEFGYQSQKRSEFKVHGRYSTVGILADLGVDFDGESIKFQDIFMEGRLNEKITAFSILGSSLNHKRALEETGSAEVLKDIQIIEYNSLFSIQGLRFKEKNQEHSLVFSFKSDDRISKTDPDLFVLDNQIDSSIFKQLRLSYAGEWIISPNAERGFLKTGINSSYVAEKFQQGLRKFEDPSFYIEPYISYRKIVTNLNGLSYGISLSTLFDSYTRNMSIEPNLSVRFVQGHNTFDFNSSYSTNAHKLIVKASPGEKLTRMKMLSFSLSWKWQNIENKLFVLSRLFRNSFADLAMYGNYLPAINDYDYSLGNELFSFNDNGLARNLGLEIMIDKSFSNGFNININASLFKSEFRNSERQWYDSRYSFGRIINLNLSKRFKLKKENILFINLAMHERGGTYGKSYILVNLEEPNRLKHFFRTDLRIQYNWKKKNVFIMDIQNVLNTRNESHVFYDPFSDQLVTKLNLGMIPVLS
ncbi:MAG: hypothetical protein KJO29_07695, partial [Bacteroidia bacterium]|nr:hypothetical protein [Bacteroidia bacterium]